MRRLAWLLVLVTLPLLAKPGRLDPTLYQPGDLVGFSTRLDEGAFLVQAVTGSPINHAGVVLEEAGQLKLWHIPEKNLGQHALPALDEHYEWGGRVHGVHARLAPPPTSEQLVAIRTYLKSVEGDRFSLGCAEVLQKAFAAAGLSLGREQEIALPSESSPFAFLSPHARRLMRNRNVFVPPHTLFEGGVRILQSNMSLHWTTDEMLASWEQHGNVDRLAQVYFDHSPVTPQEDSIQRRRFFGSLRKSKESRDLQCAFDRLRKRLLPSQAD